MKPQLITVSFGTEYERIKIGHPCSLYSSVSLQQNAAFRVFEFDHT